MAAAHPLSAIETERLRDLRMRLNRRAISDAALSTLGTAGFKLLEQVGLAGGGAFPVDKLSVDGFIRTVQAADLAMLARLVATLKDYKEKQPKAWAAAVAAGAPQALISRRLALAGREQPVDAAP